MERTLVLLKPSTIERALVGEIVNRFEKKGLRIVGMKMMQLTDEILGYCETAKPNKEVESLLDDVVDSTMRNYLRRII